VIVLYLSFLQFLDRHVLVDSGCAFDWLFSVNELNVNLYPILILWLNWTCMVCEMKLEKHAINIQHIIHTSNN
jgi:hypothetical protein